MSKIIVLFLLLFTVSCSYYSGYQEVHYYKHNEIPKSGSYYIVYEKGFDNYSNSQYLAVSRRIQESLENLNMEKVNNIEASDYILLYTYEVSLKNKEYQAVLSVRLFDRSVKVSAYNNNYTKILQNEKMIFDSSAVMFMQTYDINQSLNCLLPAIFKQQSFGENKSFNIKKKITSEKFDISNSKGIYYCLYP
ncbi:MAG: hypothetical protein FWE18_05105 [Alphaproteobacteria bacterium]|nr:hypothetical protein [Alphaproteobacteria bacterium]